MEVHEQDIKLLIIEDDPDFCELIRHDLGREEHPTFQLLFVDCLSAAMDALGKGRFDVILLDLNLPDSAGMETFTWIGINGCGIPILVLTNVINAELEHKIMQHGAEDYLSKKEINSGVLVKTICHAMERFKTKRELTQIKRQLESVNVELRKQAFLDPLTGLFNRRGFEYALSREIKWACRHRSPLAALMLDVDNFKQLNESMGFVSADHVLRKVAEVLMQNIRPTDYIARIGGDEFILLLPETSATEAMTVAQRVQKQISNIIGPMFFGTRQGTITVSIGLSVVSSGETTPEELVSTLYPLVMQRKRFGRNQIICDPAYAESFHLRKDSCVS